MLTREWILEVERNAKLYSWRILETAWGKDRSADAMQAWQEAMILWNRAVCSFTYLYNATTRAKLRAGDREVVEDVLLFLETDPWYFGSGYMKEFLLDMLGSVPLTEDDKSRLRQVIISVAGGKNRREFRRYCKLAARIATEDFERAVAENAAEARPENKGKFAYLLRYLGDHKHRS